MFVDRSWQLQWEALYAWGIAKQSEKLCLFTYDLDYSLSGSMSPVYTIQQHCSA